MEKQLFLTYSFLSSNVMIYEVRVIARHTFLNSMDITAMQVDDGEKYMQSLATVSFLFLSPAICFPTTHLTLPLTVLPS